MNHSKKGIIVASSFLVGALIIGGSAIGVFSHNHKIKVNEVRAEVQDIQTSLKSMYTEVASYTTKDGYIKSGFTLDQLEPIKKELNSYKDSYTDFGIKKDELKNEIKVVKIDKKAVSTELSKLEKKYDVQTAVNSLFSKGVLDGDKVTESPVKDRLTAKDIESVESIVLEKVDSPSKWSESINKVVKLASTQVKQQDTATKAVSKLISNDTVKEGVSRDDYTKAKKEVDKVKNEKVKTDLNSSLDKVLKVIKADEKKAEEQAKALEKMKADAEVKSQTQQSSTSNGSTSSSTQSNYSSNSGGSQSSSNSTGRNSSSSSTSNKSSSNNSSSSNSSNSTSKSSKSSSSTSSSKSSGSKNSSTSKPIGNNAKAREADGGGEIDYSGTGNNSGLGNTYETGIIEWGN